MISLIPTILTLSTIGILAAIILYFIAKKFYVYEDPKIDLVENALPAANCGGCGYAGCRAFAEACVKEESLDDLFCPVGGNDLMCSLGTILGRVVEAKTPTVAVLRCNGSCDSRPNVTTYDGDANCNLIKTLYSGETGCSFGCFGCGDCVDVCDFDALHMDSETNLPVVNDENCVSCGACVTECPQDLFELRKRNKKERKIFVSCRNDDKGGPARKACKVACIGCGKCYDICPFDAIDMTDNLAFIDADRCKLCRKCVAVCPTNAIIEVGFPPKKEKPAVAKAKPIDVPKKPEPSITNTNS